MPAHGAPPRLARRGGSLLFGAALLCASLGACDDFHQGFLPEPESQTAWAPVGTPLALLAFDAGPAQDAAMPSAPAHEPAAAPALAAQPAAGVEAVTEPAAGPGAAAPPPPLDILRPRPVPVAAMMARARAQLAEAAPGTDTAGAEAAAELAPQTPLVADALATSSDPAVQGSRPGPGASDIALVTRQAPDAAEPPASVAEAVADGDLTGLTDAVVEGLLGPPRAVRRDAPAEAWQYATPDCVLDLFFYRDTGRLRLAHVEARTIAALDAPAETCVRSVLASRLVANRPG
ncbi:MAG: hypothetical protein IRY94_18275 [Rhodospirillaceae bacterium]|nr:hypothetical protein [Rhodospirillaceae bacterium]